VTGTPPEFAQFHVGAEVVLPWTPPKAKDEKAREGTWEGAWRMLVLTLDDPAAFVPVMV
jgi:hypothetical protein